MNIEELRDIGTAKLPKPIADFFNSGSTYQETLAANTAAFSKYKLRSRVLVDVSKPDTSTVVFGNRISFPLCVSPAGIQGMAHPDGELATSRACAKAGINMGISSFANYDFDEIMKQGESSGVHYALQMYTMRDKVLQEKIIRRAEARGVKAILLTADSPVLGVRWNEHKGDFRAITGFEFPIIGITEEMWRSSSHEEMFDKFNDDTHNWARDIPYLRSLTKMEIWVKGIMTAEDTLLAIKHGVNGILVSNHGGRQLDGVPATLDALVECVGAGQGRIKIHVDGGFRSGTDIFKALALGADCCWVGRPTIWSLAYKGQEGVDLMLKLLQDDFRRCMQLCGCRTIKDISRSCLSRMNSDGVLARL
ncbi:(S)-2-hydroxy-acid oxidase [Rhizodiscina lignyota]|uniref:Oxidase FUB9 n=1 Tax=Rhizodiscina lignyota TaxID=1504668 RepID=A0A9P4INM7_9PEZI|nr:(S)-2-hydroxy-acid oxidase [Rhizodiscina lignyota]